MVQQAGAACMGSPTGGRIDGVTQTAERFSAFGTTIFAEISALALEHGAINLGQGFPDFDGPQHVKDAAAKAMAEGHNQYAPLPGVPLLRETIARTFGERFGVSADPAREVTVTCGCTEGIAAALTGLVNPGEEVVLFEPFYDSYRACVSLAGATARFVTLRADASGRFTFDPDELRAAFNGKTRAVLVNTPHNPTGTVFTRDELRTIADLCIEHDAVAIADEVYEHIVMEGEHVPIATLDGMRDRTVTLSSFGKTFSMTGWKIGWAIAPPELTAAVRSAHQFLTFAIATPLQYAAAAALDSPAAYFDGLRAGYRERRDLLVGALREIGFTCAAPEGSYFVLADHTPFGAGDDIAFVKRLIEEIGVAAIPPSFFYNEPAHGRGYVRFAFCKEKETLDRAIERLRALPSRKG